jgi:hypothetical protein
MSSERKMRKVLVLAVCLAFLSIPAMADTADSSTWGGQYECSVLPGAAGWADSGSAGFSTFQVEGDTAIQMISNPGEWSRNPGFDFVTGGSLEMRMKVEGGTSWVNNNYTMGDSGGQVYLGFLPTKVVLWDGIGAYEYAMDTTGYHTYRLIVDETEGARVYVDNGETPVLSATGQYAVAAGLSFGNVSSSWQSNMTMDYIRWSTAGAFAPVPEPTTMCLLGLGAIGALIRRKK